MDPNTVIVLRNPKFRNKTVKTLNKNNSNKQSINDGKKVNEEDEIPKLNLVGKETGMKISQARLFKNLKQKDVAKYMNMDAGLYQKYENGTALRNGQVLNKLGKYLGVKLTGRGIKNI